MDTLIKRQRAFGYTNEDVNILMEPMAVNGQEPVGSMGNDTPLAVLSERPHLLFNYFKQLFAQVSNPPLDAIREELVTSLEAFIGSEQNLFEETPRRTATSSGFKQPILTNVELEKIRNIAYGDMRATTLLNPVRHPGRSRLSGEGAGGPAVDRRLRPSTQASASS